MPTPSTYKLGAGLFILTSADNTLDLSVQVRSLTVVPSESVTEEEDIEVLTGDVVFGEADVTHGFTVTGTVLQDTLQAGGMTDWTWTHRGEVVGFRFVPRLDTTRQVNGQLRVMPLQTGGDVKARPEASFTFAGVGAFPTLGEVGVPSP